ncbi:MAG TPA: FGGY family carbohydrate kinase [Acidithiobacillus sp.]|nr:FGGY family carbohydrate kinase [Acidithiobacillus sp.]
MPTYLGVDLGTSGLRGVLIDADLQVLARAALPYPGAFTDSAAWLRGLERLAANLRTQHPRAWSALRAISLDGTSSTLLPCAEDCAALCPALPYSDQRATLEARWLAEHWPTGGAALGTSSSLSKLLWLRQHLPSFSQIKYIHHQADWVAAQLTGRFGISDRGNLLKIGLDAQQLSYPDALFKVLGQAGIDPLILPEAVREGAAMGTVQTQWTQQLHLPARTEIRAGCTDSVAAALAAGLQAVGQALTSLGSTMAFKVVHPHPISGHGIYSHFLGDHCLVGAASNSGGAALLRYLSTAQMASLESTITPGRPSGQLIYPLPARGERFPVNAPEWPGSILPDHQAAAIFQPLLEGLAYIEQWSYSILQAAGVMIDEPIRSVGGGARNLPWMQLRANVLQKAVEIIPENDAAMGSALLAASGDSDGIEAISGSSHSNGRIFLPDPAARESYHFHSTRFRERFSALSRDHRPH